MRKLRIAMAQLNTVVGDFTGNTEKIIEAIEQARSSGVDLMTTPELVITGYPPEDLVLKSQFIEANLQALEKVIAYSSDINIVVGFIDAQDDIYNAAAIISNRELKGVYRKIHLPNYGVFDEKRYFTAGKECPVYVIAGVSVGINICEDIWYESGPASAQAYNGAEVLVNISASPYHAGKGESRKRMLINRATDNIAIIAFNNLVGGQDELVFDGNSMLFNEKGQMLARGSLFKEDMIIADLDIESVSKTRLHDARWRKQPQREWSLWEMSQVVISEKASTTEKPKLPDRQDVAGSIESEVYDALVLGTHDYIIKNGFKKVVIGLSGGIDSSLVTTIAVDALGSDNVIVVTMPSKYSSSGSITDAELLANNLGVKLFNIPIEKVFQSYLDSLSGAFEEVQPDTTEENIQARIRGNLLMALSNKFGWIVLTTGNKSETATGYTTLYGDMAGGFAVIKDVPKTLVYALSRYRNSREIYALIPESVINKPPSAELHAGQLDTDSLPPYDQLDTVLTAYVEEDKSIEQIIATGAGEEMVKRVARLVDRSEYKRRQAAPGVKITPRAFGRDRRFPITSRFGM